MTGIGSLALEQFNVSSVDVSDDSVFAAVPAAIRSSAGTCIQEPATLGL